MVSSRNFALITLFLILFFAYACTEDTLDPNSCDTTDVTYTDGAASIINASCAVAGCHVTGNVSPNLEDYASASTASEFANFLGTINHEPGRRPMPEGSSKLEQCEIDILTAWVAAGSPE